MKKTTNNKISEALECAAVLYSNFIKQSIQFGICDVYSLSAKLLREFPAIGAYSYTKLPAGIDVLGETVKGFRVDLNRKELTVIYDVTKRSGVCDIVYVSNKEWDGETSGNLFMTTSRFLTCEGDDDHFIVSAGPEQYGPLYFTPYNKTVIYRSPKSRQLITLFEAPLNKLAKIIQYQPSNFYEFFRDNDEIRKVFINKDAGDGHHFLSSRKLKCTVCYVTLTRDDLGEE
jgi:hypothetical protein